MLKISSWHFDIFTFLLTAIAIPILMYILSATNKFVTENIRYFYDGVLFYISRFFTRTIAANLTLRQYCRLILASDKYLRVPAFQEINLDIDRIYVPLLLEGPLNNKNYDHNTILEAGNRIRLIGDPGSGKSSIAKRLIRDDCARALSRGSYRFPLRIELSSITVPENIPDEKLGDWFLKHLRGRVSKHSVYEIDKCFDIFTRPSSGYRKWLSRDSGLHEQQDRS